MNKSTPIPPHTIENEYPFHGVQTQLEWFDRPTVKVIGDENDPKNHRVVISDGGTPLMYIRSLEKALHLAEAQIADMLLDQPVNLDVLGFTLEHKNDNIEDYPVKIYLSKCGRFSVARVPQDPHSQEYNPCEYIMQRKNEDGSLTDIKLFLPCQRVAFHTFYGLGVEMMEPVQDAAEATAELPTGESLAITPAPKEEEAPKPEKKTRKKTPKPQLKIDIDNETTEPKL